MELIVTQHTEGMCTHTHRHTGYVYTHTHTEGTCTHTHRHTGYVYTHRHTGYMHRYRHTEGTCTHTDTQRVRVHTHTGTQGTCTHTHRVCVHTQTHRVHAQIQTHRGYVYTHRHTHRVRVHTQVQATYPLLLQLTDLLRLIVTNFLTIQWHYVQSYHYEIVIITYYIIMRTHLQLRMILPRVHNI